MKFIELEYYEWETYDGGIQLINQYTRKVTINIFNIVSIEEINQIKKLRCVKNSVEGVNHTLIHTVSGISYLVNKSYSEILNLLK